MTQLLAYQNILSTPFTGKLLNHANEPFGLNMSAVKKPSIGHYEEIQAVLSFKEDILADSLKSFVFCSEMLISFKFQYIFLSNSENKKLHRSI